MTHDPNRPTGSVPPERDRTMGGATPPPEHRGPNRGDGGSSAMALIVGALAVALIIGAFFWFAGDTQDTATLDDPAVVGEDLGNETLGTDEEMLDTDEEALGTDEDVIEQDTDVTVVEPTEEETVIDETEELDAEDEGVTGETQELETQDDEVIDETQQ